MKQTIVKGDVVVLEDGRRGQVTLVAQNGSEVRVRLNSAPEGAQVKCEACETWIIGSWWNTPAMHAAFAGERRNA